MDENISEILISAEDIKKRVKQLGETLSEDYKDKNPLLVCTLKGSVIFFADLVRELNIKCEFDFISVSSYNNNTVSSGKVRILKDIDTDVKNRHVIIIEDIIDSGITLFNLRNLLNGRNPASLKICTLLDKPSRRVADIKSDYVGFEIPDKFVIGYGMDVAEGYRNLPYIGVFKTE